jgi:hypothetical protein
LADCVRFDLSQEECSKEGAFWLPERCSNTQEITGPKGACSIGDLQVLFGAMNATCKAVVGTPEEMSSATIVLDEVCPCVGEAMMNLGERGFDCAPAGRESFSRLCDSDNAERIRSKAAKPISNTSAKTVARADVPGTQMSKNVTDLAGRSAQSQLNPSHLTDTLSAEIEKIPTSKSDRAVAKDDFFSKTQLGVRGKERTGDQVKSRHRAGAKLSPAATVLLIAIALLGLIITLLVFRYLVPSRADEPLLEEQPPAAEAQPPATEAQPPAAATEAQAVAAQQPSPAAADS